MTIFSETRLSDSPLVEAVIRGWTTEAGSTIRPAEVCWHLVFVRENGRMHPLVVGPLTSSGLATWGYGGEILWIKFKPGTFMPSMPTRTFLDSEVELPGGAFDSFWLNGSAWKLPDFDNADTFVARLMREEILVSDPLVPAVLQDQPQNLAERTVRHRFLNSTGLTQNHIRQYERAKQAEMMLQQGTSILDTVFETGYFDQPHLTRSLKQWIGRTPAQIIRMSQPGCQDIEEADYVPEQIMHR